MTKQRVLMTTSVILLTAVAALTADETQPAPSGQTVVLNTDSYWRYFVTARKPLYRKDGELVVMKHGCDSPLPPADWTAPGFDDHAWRHKRGPFFPTSRGWAYVPAAENKGYCGYELTSPVMALLCARGLFTIADPKSVGDLTLSVAYRGGVVVYLNGKEVARGHLPDADGKGLEAPAEEYPAEAYSTAAGKPIGIWQAATANADRLEQRIRRLSDVRIPAAALRKGSNVLAVEVHRAPYNKAILNTVGAHNVQLFDWLPMGLVSLDLRAAGQGGAARAGVSNGLHVWAQNPAIPADWRDSVDPLAPPNPVRIAAARNGAFLGELIVASSEAVEGLQVKVSDLTGPGVIGAGAIEVRYLLPDPPPVNIKDGRPGPLDVLDPAAPAIPVKRVDHAYGLPREVVQAASAAAGIMQPVFLTVHVPADARPGTYRGTAAVKAEGAPAVEMPVELQVAGWTLPEPKDFGTQVGLYESPESVAMQYKVDFWSQQHWKLVDRVFEYMGRLGADDVFIPVIRQTHLGNSQGMVRWIPKDGGGYTHDFSLVEKYLDAAVRGLGGKPPVVCFLLWDHNNGHRYGGSARPAKRGLLFTTLDPKTAALGEAEGPRYGTPEIREFLKPVAEGLRKIVADRGLEQSMMLGIIGDAYPTEEAFADLDAVFPGVKWVYAAHQFSRNTGIVGYETYVYVRGVPPEPSAERTRLYGWQAPRRWSSNPREGVGQRTAAARYRLYLEDRLVSGYMGFSRLGADFWVVLGREGPLGGGTLGRRYPEVDWAQLNVGVAAPAVLAPGTDGPLATVRFEMLRATAQECEARLFIEKALVDPAKRDQLGEDLSGRCQEMLDRRQEYLYLCSASLWFMADMEERAAELYGLAAEAAGKLGG